MKTNQVPGMGTLGLLALFAASLGTGCMTGPSLDTSPAFETPPIRTCVAPRDRASLVGSWKGASITDRMAKQTRTILYSTTLQDFNEDGTYRMETRMTNDTQIVSGIMKTRKTCQLPPMVVTGTWKYHDGILETVSYNETLKKAIETKATVAWYGDDEIEFLIDEEGLEKAVEVGQQAGQAAMGSNGAKLPDIKTFSKRSRDEHGVTTTTIVTMVDGKQSGEPSTWISTPTVLRRVR